MTYDPALRTPQADVEQRMGITPLEELLSERDDLVKVAAPLRARHSAGGVWDDLRRVQRATIAMKIRAQKVAAGEKVTEAYLEDAALADGDYMAFITAGVTEKIAHTELENRIQGINDQINRGQAVARYLASEAGLAR